MTRWSLFLQTLSLLLHHFLGLYSSASGGKLFYTGDASKGLRSAWTEVSPDLIVVEVTFSNAQESRAIERGHMTANLLGEELRAFQTVNGYSPKVVVIHMTPHLEKDIRWELAQVAQDTGVEIIPSYEGLKLTL